MKAFPFLLFCILIFQLRAQDQAYTIVVLGSSTAEGIGPTTQDSAWVYRYEDYLHEINNQHRVINLAKRGFTSYKIMPDEFLPPSGSGSSKFPDKERNISKALSYNPDALIINLPSNDITSSISLPDFTANLDSVKSMANNAGVLCFITTTQPRNVDQTKRDQLIYMKDTIQKRYKEYSIDFWSGIANEPDIDNPDRGKILSMYDSGDGVHLNDDGHSLLAERTIEKDILEFLNILPVSLIYFKPTEISEAGVKLEWKTASEINNNYFTIEKGKDKQSFKEVSKIAAKGNGSSQEIYNYIDNFMQEGNWYYRLKQTDIDGKYTYSKIIRIVYPFRKASLNLIYPNPTNGKLQIKLGGSCSLTIRNAAGKKVYENISFNKSELDLSDFPKGIYILHALTPIKSTTLKVILQ